MYQPFKITTVESDLKNKRIIINTNFDILESSINDSSVQLYEKSSREYLELNYRVEGKILYLEFQDWPLTNEQYILKIKTIKNVLDDESEGTLRRQIYFDSDIKNTINIISPTNQEKTGSMEVEWEEKDPTDTDTYTNRYYIEVSTDRSFYDVRFKTEIYNKNKIEIDKLSNTQYYVRCRAQDDNSYGSWSDVITFLFFDGEIKEEEEKDFDDLAPIFEKDLEIVSLPRNGETPEKIIIKFDEPIDSDSIGEITVSRRDI